MLAVTSNELSYNIPVLKLLVLIATNRLDFLLGQMAGRHEALRNTFSGTSVRRSTLVSLLVGTALNAINQGPELLRGEPPVWWKLALTYAVPFAVASYGSYAAFRSLGR
jgi:hypothetical protein